MQYSNNKYMCVIPTNIAPHYSSSISKNTGKHITYSNKNDVKLLIDIKWFGHITDFSTLTHEKEAKITTDKNMCHLLLDTVGLTKDFNLFCTTKNEIDCISYIDEKDIYSLYYIKMPDTETKYVPSNYTYYFLLDCSGSMEGTKISQARYALKLFFNSLDEGCRFNIYMFGSNF
jgi:hypothetical protein